MSLERLIKPFVMVVLIIALILTSFVIDSPPESVYAQDGGSDSINQFIVIFVGRTYDGTNDQTTFTYRVEGTGTPPDLSHFDVEIPRCDEQLNVVAFSPTDAVQFGVDPTTGIDGIKWDLPLTTSQTRTYSITFEGNVAAGEILIAVKGGPGFESGTFPGGACDVASVDVEKSVSSDGDIWHDADEPTGLDIPLDGQVWFRFDVTNNGNVDLTDLSLIDDMLGPIACDLPDLMEPDTTVTCDEGPFDVTEGQHVNVATVTASAEDEPLTDTDAAYYWGGDRPSIDIEKLVTVDGGVTWDDSDEPTGPTAVIGDPVQFKLVVTNDGNVNLTNVTLEDDTLPVVSCPMIETLEPDDSAECLPDPIEAVEGQHVNTATATGAFGDQTIMDTDAAHYFGGEEADLTIRIIIDGPVQVINGNVIVIFGFNITLDPDDPILVDLQVGDVVQIEGDWGDANVIVAVVVVVIADYDVDIDIDVNINNGGDGNCQNPPPPWAPAHGWRRKCGDPFRR